MSIVRKIREFILGRAADLYVDPLIMQSGAASIDDDHAIALVEYRQRLQASVLRAARKSLLTGYLPPEPFLYDRIDAQAIKAGHVMPAEQKRKKVTPSKPSLLNIRRSANQSN